MESEIIFMGEWKSMNEEKLQQLINEKAGALEKTKCFAKEILSECEKKKYSFLEVRALINALEFEILENDKRREKESFNVVR